MPGLVAVVTDSSACLSISPDPAACSDRAAGPARISLDRAAITVVPLRVLAGGAVADDEPGPLPAAIAAELDRGERLSTARPAPERFAAAYAAAAASGARAIVSVHLSGELSGTIGSAELAAATAPVSVKIVDSRSIGAGLGIVVVAAARAAAAGASADDVAQVAIRRAAGLGSFFALDGQEQLQAGGRLGRPGGAGSLLRSRPLLHIRDGRIAVLERVRTRAAAADRLTELAADFAAGQRADVAVQHLDNADGAAALVRRLTAAIPAAGRSCVTEAGPAIRAHTGPGLLGVVVAPF